MNTSPFYFTVSMPPTSAPTTPTIPASQEPTVDTQGSTGMSVPGVGKIAGIVVAIIVGLALIGAIVSIHLFNDESN